MNIALDQGRRLSTRRRIVLALGAGALAAPLASFAQRQPAKVARIGFLGAASASGLASRVEALRAGLRDLGYVEGKNIVIEYRWAEGKYERLPGMVAELVQLKVAVVVAAGAPAIQAAQQATTIIPIVMAATGDPVGAGFVASLPRPGGNITGLSTINVDLSSKYLELLRVAVPKLSRVAVLVNPGHPLHPAFLKNIQAAAKTTGVNVSPLQASTASQIEAAFGAMTRERAGALIVLPDPLFASQAPRITELAAKNRLPTMFSNRELVEAGGLMSYGQNPVDAWRRAATFVDKILKGAKPADLPVEQPTKFELVINLKTAKQIGLTIPPNVLARADKVIKERR
ncbi:MAG: ABC transporter substrate-binding protein [Burkholderiales bacterium]